MTASPQEKENLRRGRGRPAYDESDKSAADNFHRIGATFVLDREKSTPLWLQLRLQIEVAIKNGDLAPYSRMPSEQALCDIFGVSRPVIRAALSALASDGLAIKMPRIGMFVGAPKPETDFVTSNLSVFGDMAARGYNVTTKTFEFRRTRPDLKEQQALHLPETGSVVRIGRVYFIEGQPTTCTHIALPGHKVPGLEDLDMENKSIFATLRERYGVWPKRAERWFTAAMPSEEAVELMGVSPTDPMIWIESIAYEADGSPIEFYRAFYNSQASRIHISVGS